MNLKSKGFHCCVIHD